MCRYCDDAARGCLRCAWVAMHETWHENVTRCMTCKPCTRAGIGDLPRFEFCPFCGQKLPEYLPDGNTVSPKSPAQKKLHEKPDGDKPVPRNWTREETRRLIAMWNSGVASARIAEEFGCTSEQVQSRIHTLRRTKLGDRIYMRRERGNKDGGNKDE